MASTIDFINTIIKQFQALTVILDIAMAYINKIIQLLLK